MLADLVVDPLPVVALLPTVPSAVLDLQTKALSTNSIQVSWTINVISVQKKFTVSGEMLCLLLLSNYQQLLLLQYATSEKGYNGPWGMVCSSVRTGRGVQIDRWSAGLSCKRPEVVLVLLLTLSFSRGPTL